MIQKVHLQGMGSSLSLASVPISKNWILVCGECSVHILKGHWFNLQDVDEGFDQKAT